MLTPKNQLQEQTSYMDQLTEKWSAMPGAALPGCKRGQTVDMLAGITETNKAYSIATCLENTHNNMINETTNTGNVGQYEKFALPIIRAVLANLVAAELVTVQPMTAPTGLVFYMDATYGTSKGSVAAGQKAYDVLTGPSKNFTYTGEKIDSEIATTGAGAANVTGNLAHLPIRPGSVTFTDGALVVTDNGNGGLVGDIGAASTINYVNGAFDITFSSAITSGNPVLADYEYNMEANSDIPELNIALTSSTIVAVSKKLRARWSIEAQQDFKSFHGMNAEAEIVSYMANIISKEINYGIIDQLRVSASAGTITWDKTPPAGVPYLQHRETFIDALIAGSNLISKATQRGEATWIVAGTEVCNIIEAHRMFKATGTLGSGMAGIYKIGKIGNYDVYKDPTLADQTQFIMGLKDSNWLNTGFIYAPYELAFSTPTYTHDDFISRKGIMQRVGQKVINPRFYVLGNVTTS